MFRACVFVIQAPENTPIAPAVLTAIEEHGGRALPSGSPFASATHVVLQHQQQPAYTEAVQQQKIVVSNYWVLACDEAKRMLPVNHPLHCPFPTAEIMGATKCGVSVTSFAGLQRQILLDMLRCMGVDVQKEMRLNAVTHIIARDVDDKSSKKLEHARLPEWAGKISIVNCKWIYDCVSQWQLLPPGAYRRNCSHGEAFSWQGRPGTVSKQQPGLLAPANTGAVAALAAPSSVLLSALPAAVPAQLQQTAAKHFQAPAFTSSSTASATLADQQTSGRKAGSRLNITPIPSGLGTGLSTAKPQHASHAKQADLPQLAAAAVETMAARADRDSLGGTQGAITGLTHMALQRCNHADHIATGSADQSVASAADTQGMAVQIAAAEAATARLVAQMTHPSPEAEDGSAAHALLAHTHIGQQQVPLSANRLQIAARPAVAGTIVSQQQPSSDRENVPQQQQRLGKRSSKAQSDAAEPDAVQGAASRTPAKKRRKASAAEAMEHDEGAAQSDFEMPEKADTGMASRQKARQVLELVEVGAVDTRGGRGHVAGGNSPEAPPDPQKVVGRQVQQQFEEGVFKGLVKSYMKKQKWYRVEYEDGDRQDLTWAELHPILLPQASVPVERAATHVAKPKRKLQQTNTHTRDLLAKRSASDAHDSDDSGQARLSAKASSQAATAGRGRPAKAAAAVAGPTVGKSKPAKAVQREVTPDLDEEDAVLADEPSRADTSAGARAGAGSSPWSAGQRGEKLLLALGGMHTREQQACTSKLAKIGVACVSHKRCPGWNSHVTHVILPTLVRSVKSLAGMAGGRWILHADFVDACASAEAFMEPDEYELESDNALISPCAPRHWRQRHDLKGVGAFHMLDVLIYGACDKPGPDKDDIAAIVQSGGGSVTKCEKPSSILTKATARGLQLAIMSTERTAVDPGVKQLLKAKVPCASAQFLVEWLAHPQANLDDYMLFGSQAAWAPELFTAAQSRNACGKPHQMSPQI